MNDQREVRLQEHAVEADGNEDPCLNIAGDALERGILAL